MDEARVHSRKALSPHSFATAVAQFAVEQAARAQRRDSAALDAAALVGTGGEDVVEEGAEEAAVQAAVGALPPVADADAVAALERMVQELS